ncbi:cysteine hydrolase family protein [Chamaesiphon sp.]|uniref:cysteine hydrolase family protein n=1 Tax=Chamaesiphon sp. TaxID=2814140 RepID=UPI003593C25B
MKDSEVKQGLIVVDIQNDYFSSGNLELVGIEQAAKNAGKILQKFRDKQSLVFHIQHISNQSEATFFLPDSQGAKIHESVAPQSNEIIVVKHFPNSFRETHLLKYLKDSEIEEVVICGAMSHMCIDATTRAAFDFGFQCVVIEDACATRDLEHKGKTVKAAEVHAAFMAALAMPYAKVISTDEFGRV